MKNWVMSALLVAGMGAAKDGHAQGGIMKIDNFVPMVNFGYTAGEGAVDKKGQADLLSTLLTSRAMVVETIDREKSTKKRIAVKQDTLVFVPVAQGDTIPADGQLMLGFNESGRDIQALIHNPKQKAATVFFLNSPEQMVNAGSMPFHLVEYDAKQHGKISTWVFKN